MNPQHPHQLPEFCLRRMLGDLLQFARHEPAQAVAAAVGVGILVNLLPPRLLAGTAAVVGSVLVRPVLFSLGLTKALELCCKKNSHPSLS